MASPGASDSTQPKTTTGYKVRQSERVEFGPSIRTRARAMVAVAFAIALPALLIGVFRAGEADDQTAIFLESEALADHARRLQLAIERARTSLWRYEADASPDHRRSVSRTLDELSRSILDLQLALERDLAVEALAAVLETWRDEASDDPLFDANDPLRRLKAASGRVRRAIDPILAARPGTKPDAGAYRRAHVALDTAWRDAALIAERSRSLTNQRGQVAVAALARAGRDQLVLFLVLLFSFPVVMTLGPAWMVAPLERLKALAVRIAAGKARTVRSTGQDEVSVLTRAIGSSLSRLERDDRLKTLKIFETRKLLRKVLSIIEEPVLVVGRGGTLDYANAGAADLLGSETHHLEGQALEDICFAPVLLEAVERARSGDVEEHGVDCVLEAADGRVANVRAVLGGVQDQQGRITRVVVVLHR